MTEEEIAKALEGKFFRGPGTFHINPTTVAEDPELDLEKDRLVLLEAARRAQLALEALERKREQAEREVELSRIKWRVPLSTCIEAVCLAHSVQPKELFDHESPGAKTRRLVSARQHAAWLMKALRDEATTTQIAARLNYKDHTTVLYGIKKFEEMKMRFVPEIEMSLQYIREKTGDQTICLL